jgi:hypothetical protein
MTDHLPQTAPTSTPAEYIEIAPEALEIANCYLQLQDIRQVADELDTTVDRVHQVLRQREVRAYIDHVFMDVGFNNRFKMRSAMDALLRQKFQDLEESQTGSSKDIADLLALSHKMRMEELDRELALEKLRRGDAPKTQTNIQINDSGGANYNQLLNRLLDME